MDDLHACFSVLERRRETQKEIRQVLEEWDRRVATEDGNRAGPWEFHPEKVPSLSDPADAEQACRHLLAERLAEHMEWVDQERTFQAIVTIRAVVNKATGDAWYTVMDRLPEDPEPVVSGDFREFQKEMHLLLALLVLADQLEEYSTTS